MADPRWRIQKVADAAHRRCKRENVLVTHATCVAQSPHSEFVVVSNQNDPKCVVVQDREICCIGIFVTAVRPPTSNLKQHGDVRGRPRSCNW